MAPEVEKDVLHDRPARNGDQRLGQAARDRLEPPLLSPSHTNSLHPPFLTRILGLAIGLWSRESVIQVAAVLGDSEHARERIPWMRDRARAGGNNAMRPHGRRGSGHKTPTTTL